MNWWWALTGPHGQLGWFFSTTGRWYAVTSGIGLAAFAYPGLYWRRHNCHARWCPRFGRHPVAGTPYTVCARHHPEIPDRGASLDHIHRAHRTHRQKEEQ